MPHAIRRKKLALQYCLKLSTNANNLAYNAVFNSKFKTQFDNKPSHTRPLGFRVEDDLQNLGFKKKNAVKQHVCDVSSVSHFYLSDCRFRRQEDTGC